jgi:hypothetical protein
MKWLRRVICSRHPFIDDSDKMRNLVTSKEKSNILQAIDVVLDRIKTEHIEPKYLIYHQCLRTSLIATASAAKWTRLWLILREVELAALYPCEPVREYKKIWSTSLSSKRSSTAYIPYLDTPSESHSGSSAEVHCSVIQYYCSNFSLNDKASCAILALLRNTIYYSISPPVLLGRHPNFKTYRII